MSDTGVPDESEQLDGDELGEQPGGSNLPGIGDFPPDRSMGVEDPSLYAPDDVDTRDLRSSIEEFTDEAAGAPVDLADPDEDASFGSGEDTEPEAVGDAVSPTDGEPVPPEVAAMHVVDERDQR